MKRILVVLISIAMILAVTLPVAAVNWGRAPALVILGDSISYGYGIQIENRYGEIVKNELGGKYVNVSENGLTSEGLMKKLDVEYYRNVCKSGDFIMMTIGGNDLIASMLKIASVASGNTFTSVSNAAVYFTNLLPNELAAIFNSEAAKQEIKNMFETYQANLEAILDKIKLINPEADIFIINQYNPMSGEGSLDLVDQGLSPYFVQLNKIMEDVTKDKGAYIIDIYTPFLNNGSSYTRILYKDIHPNNAGHTVIAETIMTFLEENIAINEEWTVTKAETTTAAPEPIETTTEAPKNTEEKSCAGLTSTAVAAIVFVSGLSTAVIIKKKQ